MTDSRVVLKLTGVPDEPRRLVELPDGSTVELKHAKELNLAEQVWIARAGHRFTILETDAVSSLEWADAEDIRSDLREACRFLLVDVDEDVYDSIPDAELLELVNAFGGGAEAPTE